MIAGDSLLVLRIAAAAAAAGAVWITGSIARRIGAGPFGELLAMVGVAIVPELLADGSFYSMNIVELFLWTAIVRVLIDAIDQPSDRRWILLGRVARTRPGEQNQCALARRRHRRGAVAHAVPSSAAHARSVDRRDPLPRSIFLPHVLWQIANGWPTLEFIRNASRDKMQVNTPAVISGRTSFSTYIR